MDIFRGAAPMPPSQASDTGYRSVSVSTTNGTLTGRVCKSDFKALDQHMRDPGSPVNAQVVQVWTSPTTSRPLLLRDVAAFASTTGSK